MSHAVTQCAVTIDTGMERSQAPSVSASPRVELHQYLLLSSDIYWPLVSKALCRVECVLRQSVECALCVLAYLTTLSLGIN